MAVHRGGSGLPMPVAERSLRASCPPLTRCFLRFAILASRKKQRRLPGTGSPSLPPVAQVFNLCVFHDSHAIPEGEAAGRRHAQKSVRRVPHGGRSGAFEKKTHKSRRRRACLRPPAVPRRRARIECDPYAVEQTTPGWTRTSDPGIRNPMLYPPELRARNSSVGNAGSSPARQPKVSPPA